jgi:septum site-determining protein MinD
MIDTDIGLRNLDVIMGVENRIVYDLVDVAENKCPYTKALVRDKRFEGLFLLPAAQSRDKSAVTTTQMKHIVRQMEENFDYILIDCPAGMSDNVIDFCACADRAVVVSTPDHTSLRGGQKMGILMGEQGQQNVKIAVNRVRSGMINRGEAVNIDAAMDQAGLGLLGIVPEDKAIIACGNGGKLLAFEKKSPAWQAYFNIAGRIKGEKIRLLDSVPGRY